MFLLNNGLLLSVLMQTYLSARWIDGRHGQPLKTTRTRVQ